jgi:hypothetical protein
MKSHPLLPTQPLVTITNEEITLVSRGRGLYKTVWGWNRVQRATLFAPAWVGLRSQLNTPGQLSERAAAFKYISAYVCAYRNSSSLRSSNIDMTVFRVGTVAVISH